MLKNCSLFLNANILNMQGYLHSQLFKGKKMGEKKWSYIKSLPTHYFAVVIFDCDALNKLKTNAYENCINQHETSQMPQLFEIKEMGMIVLLATATHFGEEVKGEKLGYMSSSCYSVKVWLLSWLLPFNFSFQQKFFCLRFVYPKSQ